MLIRCEDCGLKESWRLLPENYFQPNGAMSFWLAHGHIPKLWTFECPCGARCESGGLVAIAEGWDDIALAQNDWGFCQSHYFHDVSHVLPKGVIL